MDAGNRSIAVVYLARGADPEAEVRFRRFLASYRAHVPGIEHKLFVICKGFPTLGTLSRARQMFQEASFACIETDDDDYDIGAYAAAARVIPSHDLCFLNSNSEIASHDWLAKLAMVHRQPGIGMVCATGSYETLWPIFLHFPKFPNVHARTNAFMIERRLVIELFPTRVPSKKAAFEFESGPESLTRRLYHLGLAVEVVGRNGRGYPPQWWPVSRTFRQADQSNLLVEDNQTRAFEALPWPDKHSLHERTWGRYVQQRLPLIVSGG